MENRVKLEEIEYKSWGSSLKLTNGVVELVISLEFGPRIMRYSFLKEENILYEDTENSLTIYTDEFKKVGWNEKWKLYGGHRIWGAPQSDPMTYYPDNRSVDYEFKDNTLKIWGQVEETLNIQKVLEITLSNDETEVRIVNRIYNRGLFPIELSVWGVTAMDGGGKEFIPMPNSDTEPLENRVMKFWPYSNLEDERFNMYNDYITLEQTKKIEDDFKFGINNEMGYSCYLKDDTLFQKRVKASAAKDIFYETYVNGSFLEMEFVGPKSIIPPDSNLDLEEIWSLKRVDSSLDIEKVCGDRK